jgi:hypothetical protein
LRVSQVFSLQSRLGINHLKLQNYSGTTRLKLRCWQFCWQSKTQKILSLPEILSLIAQSTTNYALPPRPSQSPEIKKLPVAPPPVRLCHQKEIRLLSAVILMDSGNNCGRQQLFRTFDYQ